MSKVSQAIQIIAMMSMLEGFRFLKRVRQQLINVGQSKSLVRSLIRMLLSSKFYLLLRDGIINHNREVFNRLRAYRR